jgi:ribosomal protein L11 methyltransferase
MVVEARIAIYPAQAEAWADILLPLGDARWSVFEDVLAQQAWVRGFFESEGEARREWQRLRAVVPPGMAHGVALQCLPVADADWRESYKAHFRAWRCGRLHWVPEWERSTHRIRAGEAVVYLDPGLAFGTGNHETTRLCVRAMVNFAGRTGAVRRRKLSVIDAGCGSGILAISAARLGFGRVLGFDADPAAVAIARENARRNSVSTLVRLVTAEVGPGLARRSADLVLANIQADVLTAHAVELVSAVRRPGWLVLSGILAREADEVAQVFREAAPHGRIFRRISGEWCGLRLSLGA